jgi:hypothetical protein
MSFPILLSIAEEYGMMNMFFVKTQMYAGMYGMGNNPETDWF